VGQLGRAAHRVGGLAARFDAHHYQAILCRQEGLEHPLVAELRDALAAYLEHDEAVRAAHGDLAGEYRRRLDELHRARSASPVDLTALESAAWWLAAMGQAQDELAQVRAQFSGPVLVGQIGREAIEAKLDEFEHSSQQTRQTHNNIAGANVVGTATVESHTIPALFDAPNEARLRVTSRGSVHAPHNLATSGRVSVSSSSDSQFTAVADIYWNGTTFAATPPQVSVDMHSTITGIDAPWLLRRAAARRVQGGRASAEAEGESIIRDEVAASMTERLNVAVPKLNAKVARFLKFLASTGNTAEKWTTHVRPTSVQIGYRASSPSGLGSLPHEPPPLKGEESLGLSFHDFAIEGALRPQLAGAEWTDVAFARMQREITGGNNEEFMIGLDPKRWSVQWNWRSPVQIHFNDKYATVVFRFTRVEIDGLEYKIPFEVRANLDAFVSPQGLGFNTREPATVAALDSSEQLPPHFQSFLERKFRGLFTSQFYLDSMQFPPAAPSTRCPAIDPVGSCSNRTGSTFATRTATPTSCPPPARAECKLPASSGSDEGGLQYPAFALRPEVCRRVSPTITSGKVLRWSSE